MTHSSPPPDWDPKADDVQRDQYAAYDEMRRRCPVAFSESFGWSLFKHADIERVLHDHETFSNDVSQHLSVPNGMDPPEHTEYRRVIVPYFTSDRMDRFEPQCRSIAAELVERLRAQHRVELVSDFARHFAVRIQCAFLGWPSGMEEPLLQWTRKNQAATHAEDRTALAEIAREFESYISALLQSRRNAGGEARTDVTAELMSEEVHGRKLREEEIVSIMRNWTAGEVGTITASIAILAHYLSEHSELQEQLRAAPSQLPEAIEEILRIRGPLVSNRRKATHDAHLGGRTIRAGDRLSLIWVSANRDEERFEAPTTFQPGRDQSANLLWGSGIHVCPGAPLARLELRVAMEELLRRTERIEPQADAAPENARYPAAGVATLPLEIT